MPGFGPVAPATGWSVIEVNIGSFQFADIENFSGLVDPRWLFHWLFLASRDQHSIFSDVQSLSDYYLLLFSSSHEFSARVDLRAVWFPGQLFRSSAL